LTFYFLDVTDLDTFSVEYEPPETNSEDENDDDDSDEGMLLNNIDLDVDLR